MAVVYQVIGWQEHFEGAKSRTYSNKSSCQMPTKHGLGYRKLIKSENGAALFGAWCAMIQVLSRHKKPRQGYVTNDGTLTGNPYSGADLETLTEIKAKYFEALFQVAASQEVGWLRIPDGYHADTNYPLDSDSDSDLNSDLDMKKSEPKKPYGEFQKVTLTDDEYKTLVERNGEPRTMRAIEILDGYIASKNAKYISHFAVMKKDSWVWDRVDRISHTSQEKQKVITNAGKYGNFGQ